MSELVVLALGGNAIKQAHESGTTEEQLLNVDKTAEQIAAICAAGYRVVVTHGNGPQAGALLLQQEEGVHVAPPQSLAICGAMTQGQIGWMMQNRLQYRLKQHGVALPVATVVTQVEVDPRDPDFQNPSKPVGSFYDAATANKMAQEKGYIMREVKPGVERGWRRVVPSPIPKAIVEREPVKALLDAGQVVIASGGGGVPVACLHDGDYEAVDAVIDKDRAAVLLAETVEADCFVILTDVPNVYLNFNKPDQKELGRITRAELEGYIAEGHFLKGSMGPKVEAALEFVAKTGKRAVITALDCAVDGLAGTAGTQVLP